MNIIDNFPTSDIKTHAACDSKIEGHVFGNSNYRFDTTHNIAMRKSIKINAKYHLVLNPDVYFDERVLEELFDYMENNPDVGLVMPKILYPNGEIQYLCKLLLTSVDLIFRRFLHLKNLKKKSGIRR